MSSDLENKSTLEDFGLTSLPIEWDAPVIGDLLAEDRGISVGVMYPGNHCDQGIPLVKAGDLKSNWINPNPPFRITPDKHYEYRRTELEGGELLISLVGNAGQTAVVPSEMKGWNVARAVAVVRLSKGADPHFIKYTLQSPALGQLMKSWCNTTVQETLNLKEIKRLPIPFPEIAEQKSIAHILGTLDDKIELNRKTNETLEAMAKALFKSWFVDFDPVRAKAEGRPTGLPAEISDLFPDSFEDSELGDIPSGWEVGGLEEFLVLQRGFDLPAPQRIKGAYPVVAASGVSGTHNEPMAVAPGVVTGRSGVLGKVFYIQTDFFPLNTTLWAKEFRLATPIYGYFLLCDIDFAVFNAGSAVPTLNRNHLGSLRFPLPPRALVVSFTEVAVDLMKRREGIVAETSNLTATRDALLPKLISGEIRIPDAKRFVSQLYQ